MLGALAIVGFVVLPALLALDLLAPGRHFSSGRGAPRFAVGAAVAVALGLGISAALGQLVAAAGAWHTGLGLLLGAAAAGLLDRRLVFLLPPARGARLVTPAAWLDDRVGKLALHAIAGGLVGEALQLPAPLGMAATLALVAAPTRAVAAAVATPVRFEEGAGSDGPRLARGADRGRRAA